MGHRGVQRGRPVANRGGPGEDSSRISVFFTNLDRGIRTVCQHGVWHDPTISQLGARSEGAGGVVAPRWDGSVPGGTWRRLWIEFATDRVLSATRGTIGVLIE
jgi:hypothetical protein